MQPMLYINYGLTDTETGVVFSNYEHSFHYGVAHIMIESVNWYYGLQSLTQQSHDLIMLISPKLSDHEICQLI